MDIWTILMLSYIHTPLSYTLKSDGNILECRNFAHELEETDFHGLVAKVYNVIVALNINNTLITILPFLDCERDSHKDLRPY